MVSASSLCPIIAFVGNPSSSSRRLRRQESLRTKRNGATTLKLTATPIVAPDAAAAIKEGSASSSSYYADDQDWDESFVQARWMMPPIVEQALLGYSSSQSIAPLDLLNLLDMATGDRQAARDALETKNDEKVLVTIPGTLTQAQCQRLRIFVDKKTRNDGVDNVDGCPDHQVNIHENKLWKLLGTETRDRVYALPNQLTGNDDESPPPLIRAGVFLRRYQATERPWMPFHADGNAYTVNIALNDDTDYEGGHLLALYHQGLQRVDRQAGDATCHSGTVYHAVSAMRAVSGIHSLFSCMLSRLVHSLSVLSDR